MTDVINNSVDDRGVDVDDKNDIDDVMSSDEDDDVQTADEEDDHAIDDDEDVLDGKGTDDDEESTSWK